MAFAQFSHDRAGFLTYNDCGIDCLARIKNTHLFYFGPGGIFSTQLNKARCKEPILSLFSHIIAVEHSGSY